MLLPDDLDVAMEQPESLLLTSKPEHPDSSLSPCHQENKSKRDRNHQQHDQEEKQEKQEQEKLQYESRNKEKREYNDDNSQVEILETPRRSAISYYCPPRPRKPKATPAMKGKDMWFKKSVVLLDVAGEVESMFPPSVLQDFGKKIKKARS